MPDVICRAAGLLVYLPWAPPWHVPGTEAVTRRRDMIPAELSGALLWLVAGPIADPGEPGMRWRELLLCALEGSRSGSRTPRRTGSTSARPAPRTNSSPFPQVRAVILTAARTKGTLGMEFGPSCDGEQTLTRRLVKARPGLFGGQADPDGPELPRASP